MAVPTLTVISPAKAAPGSTELVEFTGTGYNVPATPVPDAQYPGVRVWVNGVESDDVKPVLSTKMFVRIPRYLGKLKDLPASVNVRIANVDANGGIIPPEDIIFPNAFTFEVEEVRDPEDPEFWILAIREAIDEFERQTGLLVHFGTHIDWTEEGTLDYFEATPPVLGILDLDVRDFPYRDISGRVEQPAGVEEITLHRDSEQSEFMLSMILVARNKDELLRHYGLVRRMGMRTKYLFVPRTVSTPDDRVKVKFRLDLDADMGLNFRQVLASMTFGALVGPCPVEDPDTINRAWEAVTLVHDLRNSL